MTTGGILDFESVRRLRWPLDQAAADGPVAEVQQRAPSTDRTKRMKARFLESKMMLDPEFAIRYTESWREHDGEALLLRRAYAYKDALEALTPVIGEDELLVVGKSRFERGAVPYLQYSAKFFHHFLKNLPESESAEIYDLSLGGGRAERVGIRQVGGIFGVAEADLGPLTQAAEYWDGRSLEDVAERWLGENFPENGLLQRAFQSVVFPPSVISIMEGRWIPAYDMVVERGLEDIIRECEEHLQNTIPTTREVAEQCVFWRAAIVSCQGVLTWIGKYAARAQEMAEEITCQCGHCWKCARRTELLEVADALRQVPAKPARTFREALHAAWIAHVAIHLDGPIVGLSPGRWGQLLYPYYRKDIDEGRLTRGQALELLECLRLKFSSIEYVSPRSWASLASLNLFQHMVVGGLRPDGSPAENELEELILESGMTMQTTQPTLGVLVDPKTSERFLMKAAECTKAGAGYPAWFSNRAVIEHLLLTHQEEGVRIEDARMAGMGGCVETQMQGTCHGICHPAFVNEAKILELVLHHGKDPASGLEVIEPHGEPLDSWDSVWRAWSRYHDAFCRVYMRYWNHVMLCHRELTPLVIGSVLVKDCVQRGKPLDSGGARYNKTVTLLNSGMVNVANSLSAIRKVCFEDRRFSLEEVIVAAADNFGFERGDKLGKFSMLEQKRTDRRHEKLHRALLEAPKYGNDDPYVDDIFVACWNHWAQVIESETTYLGFKWVPAALSISAHAPFGRACGATPDGRLAGITLADGILSAFPGTDTNGPLALLASAVKVSPIRYRSLQLNMKLHPHAVEGREGSRRLIDLCKGYFDQGGYHVQFNVVDSEMLRDAQARPDRYRDLIVRVAGFSAYWCELSKPVQDEIIARTEYCQL